LNTNCSPEEGYECLAEFFKKYMDQEFPYDAADIPELIDFKILKKVRGNLHDFKCEILNPANSSSV